MRSNPLDGPGMGYGPAAGTNRRGSPVVTVVLALSCLLLAAALAFVLLRPTGGTAAPAVTVTATVPATAPAPGDDAPRPGTTAASGSTDGGRLDRAVGLADPGRYGCDRAGRRAGRAYGTRRRPSSGPGWSRTRRSGLPQLQVTATDSLLDKLADIDPAKIPKIKPTGDSGGGVGQRLRRRGRPEDVGRIHGPDGAGVRAGQPLRLAGRHGRPAGVGRADMNPTVAKMAGQIALSLVRSRTGRRVLIAVLVLQLIALTVILWLPTYFASITATSIQRVITTAPSNCGAETAPTITGDGGPVPQVRALQPRQVEVARTIYLTALGVGIAEKWSSAKTERAVLVALATAMQESQLGAYPGIDRPNGDGDAGVFQQRQKPGWYGTLEQVTQVGYAARVFLRGKVVSAADVAAARRAGSGPAGPAGYTIPGLKQVRGWENMAVTVAAQKVQRSAFPDAYAKHERISRTLLAVFKDKIDPQSAEAQVTGESMLCGPADAMTCPPTGLGAESGLNPDALRVLRCTARGWPQVRTFYGIGSRPNVSDHPYGNAVDVMIPDYTSPAGVAAGDQIARWLLQNRKQLGVKYVIWKKQIWSVAAAGGGLAALLRDQPALRPRTRLHLRRLGRVRRGRGRARRQQRPAGAPGGQRGAHRPVRPVLLAVGPLPHRAGLLRRHRDPDPRGARRPGGLLRLGRGVRAADQDRGPSRAAVLVRAPVRPRRYALARWSRLDR